MITRIIKTWDIVESNRSKITLTANTRFNNDDTANPVIQLKELGRDYNGNYIYDTGSTNTVKLWTTKPNCMQKWLMFEPYWRTNEEDYREYGLYLTNKTGNWFTYDPALAIPRIGDKVYQGNYVTTIEELVESTFRLADATNFSNGQVYILRSTCNVLFRLWNDTSTVWFNKVSGEWEPAGPNDWNTEFEISLNIQSLSIASFGKSIGIEMKLISTDPLFTPVITDVKLLGRYEIEFTEDMIYDTVIRTLQETIDVTTNISIMLNSATDLIDFATEYVVSNTGYNFMDGVSVYNLTTDPEKLVNLFESYTKGAPRTGHGFDPGQLKLTAIQDANSVLEIKMKFTPEIAITSSLDFYEVNRVPSIVFERIEKKSTVAGINRDIANEEIRDKINLIGVREESPEINDLVFEYACFTSNQTDQHRLGEAIQRLFSSLIYVTSWGLDEPYPVIVREVFRSTNTPNAADINTHVGRFDVLNVKTQVREPKDVYLIDYFNRSITTI